ncbi:hypothetical protein XENORESO_014141, partial [Xenotaenia resolanae]
PSCCLRHSPWQRISALCRMYLSVWVFSRASQWWDIIVSGFTNTQWLQNFRMSDQMFCFLCNKLLQLWRDNIQLSANVC